MRWQPRFPLSQRFPFAVGLERCAEGCWVLMAVVEALLSAHHSLPKVV